MKNLAVDWRWGAGEQTLRSPARAQGIPSAAIPGDRNPLGVLGRKAKFGSDKVSSRHDDRSRDGSWFRPDVCSPRSPTLHSLTSLASQNIREDVI